MVTVSVSISVGVNRTHLELLVLSFVVVSRVKSSLLLSDPGL